ncbi:hypothetical protein ACPOL_4151 [Acidisarcina polymorpha]|uniref:Uncharacterized protein n=1 Tax=Acidisarcina polymorpha TaxID=2211140 RepID=A0A2Z5G2V1_9BACT|nr:hypothetical protein [Acidisarcina polymorpha]AXC13428.1 hypothetical protein ACPOL_4151 [Acidisarcina polymorpha]
MTLIDRILDIATRPVPLRTLLLRRLLVRWPVGSYRARLLAGGVNRPPYGWCLYHAALEAKALGHKAMTVVELGVAGGNGLVCLSEHRQFIQRAIGIEVVVAGFDGGNGLPASQDPRDLLYCWPAGSFEMDRAALERRIAGRAELIIGDVRTTLGGWNPRPDAPLGAVLFDLDLYSSTMGGFTLLEKANVLPRIWCYFDDICGYSADATTDRVGEREAVRQFNLAPERDIHKDHLSLAYTFKGMVPEAWHQHIYLYHRVSHPDYNRCLSTIDDHQLPLDAV